MSAIKKGDLVMVVGRKPCGCIGKADGTIFVCGQIRPSRTGFVRCKGCKQRFPEAFVVDAPNLPGRVIHLSRLIRIDPPATDESTETRKEVTA